MRRRRKLFPVVAGVGALVVLTVAAFSWKEITIQYRPSRLRRDPGYVSEVLEHSEGAVFVFCRALVLEILGLWGRRADMELGEILGELRDDGAVRAREAVSKRRRIGLPCFKVTGSPSRLLTHARRAHGISRD